jgi:nucleotidyltransferase substrate binding protein (TIGR01987 family)
MTKKQNKDISQDIRWQERFVNYKRAFSQLSEFLHTKNLNKLEKQGLIQAFEYTHELAWKVLADFLKDRGNTDIFGSKDATREAFNLGIITHGDIWMDMIKSRNLTSHTYNEETAEAIVHHIQTVYHKAFCQLKEKLEVFLL